MTESSRKPGDSHTPLPDDIPARLSLTEVAALFPRWELQTTAPGAYTATLRAGSALHVVAAHTPAELAARIRGVEREDPPPDI